LLTVLNCRAQKIEKKSTVTLRLGPGYIKRQDMIFSPFVHSDFSLMNLGLSYSRESNYFQKISLDYGNFNPMVTDPYEFTFHSEPNTAYPHSFNLINLDYQFGKDVKDIHNGILTAGGLFSADIQAMNYVYGRISSFGYLAFLGAGAFGSYTEPITEKSMLVATLKLPLFVWLARSPYLVNDDEYINNASSHSGFKTFMAFFGDGKMATWNEIQTLELELKYEYDLNKRWGFGAAYLFGFIHVSQPRNFLSFRNSLNLSASFKI
jgi:hypothetical protein